MSSTADKFLETIQEKIRGIGTLPTLPNVAVEVMGMARNERTTMAEIASKIDGDPSISAKLLRVANSSLYGLPRFVTTTEAAILVIGLREVQNIILSVSVLSAFPAVKGKPSFDREKFWHHCSGTGIVARFITRRLGLQFQGEEFSGGVLHDVGKIVLDQYFHERFLEALDLQHSKGMEGFEAEREIFGTTHAEVGGWMLNYWKLPVSLARAAAFHHHPANAKDDRSLVAVISLANVMAKMYGMGLEEETKEVDLASHLGWKVLAEANPSLSKIDSEVVYLGVKDDIQEAKRLGELSWFKG